MSAMRVLSRSSQPFADRAEAGRLLAAELEGFRDRHPVILGIPRGGVVIAAVIAERLATDLDIVLARKIGAPQNPELALGALAEDGRLFLDEHLAQRLGATREFVEQQRIRELAEIERRGALFRSVHPRVPLKGRTAIVVDDGLATGATMEAALWVIHRERPERVVAAVPVGAEDTVARLAGSADDFICLRVPPEFNAVGRFYRDFRQVEDAEVLELLRTRRPPTAGGRAASRPDQA